MSGLRSQTFRIKRGADGFKRSGDKLGIGLPPDVEPLIQAISGSLSQSGSLIISGSNFTAKRNGQLLFRDFDEDVASLGDPLLGFDHGLTEPYRYSDDGAFVGNRFARCNMQGGYNFDTRVVLDGSFKELFCEHWVKVLPEYIGSDADTPNDPGDSPQIKFTRLSPSIDDDAKPNPSLGMTDIGVTGGVGCYNYLSTADGTITPSPAVNLPYDNTWARISMYCRLSSTPGAADGERYIKTSKSHGATNSTQHIRGLGEHFASPTGAVPIEAWRGEQIVTQREAPDAYTLGEHFRSVFLPFYTRGYQRTVIGVDCLMINDSPERVVLSNRSTWTASYNVADTTAKAVIQKTLERSPQSITVHQRVVDHFGQSGAVYAYIVNSDGRYNETGYLVRTA